MTTVPAALFEPDKSRYNANATDDILNVVPQADGYGPLPSFKPFVPAFEVLSSDGATDVLGGGGDVILVVGPGGTDLSGEVALPGTLGGIFVRLTDGTTALFVGTETNLYKFNTSDYTWENVGGPYTVGTGMRWSFALFGTTVYAQNFSDYEQKFDLSTDSAFSDNTTAPRCAYLATIGPFLVRGRLVGDEDAVQWCGIEDPTANDAGLRFSDIQILPEGAGVRGLIPMKAGIIVPTRSKTQAIVLNLGTNWVFTRDILDNFHGCIAPYSIQCIGQDDFILYTDTGWVRGAAMTPIGENVWDRWFAETISYADRTSMISGVDPLRKIYWCRVRMSDGSYRLFGYKWTENKWTVSNADAADMFRVEAQGVTIDQMDSFFATIDDIDVPYDSSFWQGGMPDFAAITSDGFLALMNGAPMAARIATNDLVLIAGGRSFVNEVRAVSDATEATLTHSGADYPGGSFSVKSATRPTARSKRFTPRGDAGVHRFLYEIDEGHDWSIFSGLMIPEKPTGKS